MKSLRYLLVAACLAMASLAGCNTVPVDTGSGATPAVSHYKADLALGYETLTAVRSGVLIAAQEGKLDANHVRAAQDQCNAVKATLDLLRQTGDTPTNQSTLRYTVLAAQALTVLITASQGVQK
jgi:hypothetical protein